MSWLWGRENTETESFFSVSALSLGPHFVLLTSPGVSLPLFYLWRFLRVFNDLSSISIFPVDSPLLSPAWHTQYAGPRISESRFLSASYLSGNRCSLQKSASHGCTWNNHPSEDRLPMVREQSTFRWELNKWKQGVQQRGGRPAKGWTPLTVRVSMLPAT